MWVADRLALQLSLTGFRLLSDNSAPAGTLSGRYFVGLKVASGGDELVARYRILVTDAKYDDDGEIERRLSGPNYEWIICRAARAEKLPADALETCDGILTWHVLRYGPKEVARLKRCRIIVRAGVGYDHIDLQATAAAGIPVSNTPDYGTM